MYTEAVSFPNVTASPRILQLNNPGKTARVSVRVCRMSAKTVTLLPTTCIWELHEVKVL